MPVISYRATLKIAALIAGLLITASSLLAQSWVIHNTSDNSTIVKRHETGSVVFGSKLYSLGGRGSKPVQVFDATRNSWSTLAPLPLELHHFQPVVLNGYLYIVGAFTCCYPTEPSVADIYRLNLATNTWETHGTIPTTRLRGSAGAVVYDSKIYLIGGNTNGHSGGAVGWLDEYDPLTGNWRALADAPNARDHFSAALIGNKLIAASGRQTDNGFAGTVAATDIYDFSTNTWTTAASLPTPRAGAIVGVKSGNVIIAGGETSTQFEAHNEVEAYNLTTNEWRSLPTLGQGRHGSAGGVIGNSIHIIAGNLKRGGGQEVTSHEKLTIADVDGDGLFDFEDTDNNDNPNADSDNDGLTDIVETDLGTDPFNADSDNDELSDFAEVQTHTTDPLSVDTDYDGLTDYDEIITYLTNPNTWDSDGDGVSDATEVANGTIANNDDQDGDGILNSAEGTEDSDNDSIADYIDLDSDNDGIPDIIENGRSDDNNDGKIDSTDSNPANSLLTDTDMDGISNILDLDSDQDSLSDLAEAGHVDAGGIGVITSPAFQDTNRNGWHDGFEGTVTPDSDADSTPDFLDLDSNDDGVTDLVSSGIVDSDADGKIDNFTDTNYDGMHDDIPALERLATGQPDTTDQHTDNQSPVEEKSGGGSDPLAPATLLLIMLAAALYQYQLRSQHCFLVRKPKV